MKNVLAWLWRRIPMAWRPRYILAQRQRAHAWRIVRKAHLEKEPCCQACGRTKNLIVHHVIPVSFDPKRELDPDNLLTLCKNPCHIVFGHYMDYHCCNLQVRKMVAEYRRAKHRKFCLYKTDTGYAR
jgi:hypothetical protein